jgi:DNA repair protein RecO (recombination protein O)
MSSDGRIALQPAFLLHRKPYRDTSLLLEAFSAEHGRLGLVARGARGRRGGMQGLLQPLQALLLSWSGRGELMTLTCAEPQGAPLALRGGAVISGFYLNELLMRLLPRHDPHPELYQRYVSTLQRLAAFGADEWALRLFERDLLQELGYGLLLTHEGGSGEMVEPAARYCYHPEFGPQRMGHDDEPCLLIHGATLLTLEQGEEGDSRTRGEAKRLMRMILSRYLGSRPLASRELFRQRYAAGQALTKNEEKE